MPRRPVTFLGKTKALYEWVLGFFIVITGIIVLCSFIVIEGSPLIPLPLWLRNLLLVLDLIFGGILLAIWGEQATVDPIKSVSAGVALVVFSILLILYYSSPGLILGTLLLTIGVYLAVHGTIELGIKK